MSTSAFLQFINRLNHLPEDKRLPLALGLAIGVSLLLVTMSVIIYSAGGFSKFDLSRPGFESERKQVTSQDDSQKMYDRTSPITSSAIDAFIKEYDASVKEVNGFGDFKDQALDDNDIQLTNRPAAPN